MGNYNTAFAGVLVQLPFIDEVRKARARETTADAQHAFHQVEILRSEQRENRLRLQHAIAELSIQAELSDLDESIAEDELKSMLIQLRQGNPTGPPPTPKEEQTSRLQERQRYLAILDAKLQVRRSQISLLRQAGELSTWLQSLTQPALR